jgi:Ala-tRNA(Pro) deacylase
MAGQPSCLERLKEYLGREKVAYQVTRHPARYTAQERAQVEHVSGRLIAKVVMVFADEKLLVVVVPETAKVNLSWVREASGARETRLAPEEEFSHVFPDCKVGAMPPFGHLYGILVLVDAALARDPVILFNAGSHEEVVTMTFADFANLVRPRIGVLGTRGRVKVNETSARQCKGEAGGPNYECPLSVLSAGCSPPVTRLSTSTTPSIAAIHRSARSLSGREPSFPSRCTTPFRTQKRRLLRSIRAP